MQTEPESPAPRQRAAWRARAAMVTAFLVAVVGAAGLLWPDEPARELRADGVVTPVGPTSPPTSVEEPGSSTSVTARPPKTSGTAKPGTPSTRPGGQPASTVPPSGPVTTATTTVTTAPPPTGPGQTATTTTTAPRTTPTTAPAGPNAVRPPRFTDVVAFVDTDRDSAEFHLAIVDVHRGEPRRLTKMDGTEFSWAPDGVRIAFPRRGAIHILDTATGAVQSLPDGRGSENQPVWSPDGRWIAYLDGSANEDKGLWLMQADGTERHRISGAITGAPAWSPDGGLLAFGAMTGGSAPELHVLSVDGTALRNLTAGPGGGSSPVFSPDGARLAFTTDENTLAVAEMANSTVRRYQSVGRAINPSWAQNGRQVLVEHYDGERTSIRSVDLADGTARQLSPADEPQPDQEPQHYGRPAWVPGGADIIYAGDCGGSRDNLCRLDPSGRISLLVESARAPFAFQPRP